MSDEKSKLVAALALGRDRNEARSTLIDCLAATGAEVMRKRVGKFEIAIVYPAPDEVTEDRDGWLLCEAMEELGRHLLANVERRPGRRPG